MKKILSLIALLLTFNAFALTNDEVKAIVQKAIAVEEPGSDLNVVKVTKSYNPFIGLGQVNDFLFIQNRDFEFKNIFLTLKTFTGTEHITVNYECKLLVSLDLNLYEALVDIRGCKSDNETFKRFPENVYIENLDVADLF